MLLEIIIIIIYCEKDILHESKVFESVKSCKYFMNMEICFPFLRLISLI